MSIYIKKYNKYYPNEPKIISKATYGKRKWKILKSMNKNELIQDFSKKNIFFGNKINKNMTKTEILKILKKYSAFV
jgi:hypothetical protein